MTYKYCPICGSSLTFQLIDEKNIQVCSNSSCNFIFWQNSKPCAAVLIPNEKGEVLMTVRAQEPEKNKLDLPGGFLELGEDPYEGAKREAKEELNVDIAIDNVLGFATDPYSRPDEYVLIIAFTAHIIAGTPTAADDAASLEWIDPKTIDPAHLAFTNNQKFLEAYINLR